MLNASLRALAEPQAPRCGASGNSKPELSLDDLRLLRVLLDRALQPVPAFDGFEHIEQFQTSALRYQINFSSYALALAQATHLPALQGYMHLAQRNLAAKQLDHRIWRYWRLENLWGNLDPGADPVARDNIMLSGFLAAQLAFAGNATGRRDHDAPGSLAFRHPSGAVYAYSLPSIARLLGRAYARAPFGLLACEPNWVYPLCNAITAAAIRAQDTALEHLCDAVSPEPHPAIGAAKDVAAGAVLLGAVGAAIIGAITFASYLSAPRPDGICLVESIDLLLAEPAADTTG
jgi:hypothetical protein